MRNIFIWFMLMAVFVGTCFSMGEPPTIVYISNEQIQSNPYGLPTEIVSLTDPNVKYLDVVVRTRLKSIDWQPDTNLIKMKTPSGKIAWVEVKTAALQKIFEDTLKRKYKWSQSDWDNIQNNRYTKGMTKIQVILSRGKPTVVNRNSENYLEQWTYGYRTYLYFTNGVLVSWDQYN